MGAAGYNLLGWPDNTLGGYAVRQTEDDSLEFWVDADGALVTGDDPGFCRTLPAGDTWLFADAQGNLQKPSALANVPEADGTDTQTAVRIIPAEGDAPPIHATTPPGTYTVYRIGVKCYRLLLAKNVVLVEGTGGGVVCDLSNAVLDWNAPRETHPPGVYDPENPPPSQLGEGRPVAYAAGNDWQPSELAEFDIQCSLSPVSDGMGGDIHPTFGQGGKVQWNGGHRVTESNPPMYVRDYWTTHWDGEHRVKTRHELYWSPTSDAAGEVMGQLPTQEELVARVFGVEPAAGTAFDLVLLCKTYWWYEKRNAAKHIGSPTYGQDVGIWEWVDSGYFNTKLSGWLVQIVPVPPKERSIA